MNEIREELAKIFLQRPSPYLGADRVLTLPIRTVTEPCPNRPLRNPEEGGTCNIVTCPLCHGSGTVTRSITLGEGLDVLNQVGLLADDKTYFDNFVLSRIRDLLKGWTREEGK